MTTGRCILSSPEAVLGIIFPLSQRHIERFFEENKTVFVKFYGKESLPSRLRPGSKLYFYQSGGGKEIVGEAKIVDISSGTLDQVWSRFAGSLFLSRSEFEAYVGERKQRRMLVLVLERARKYQFSLRLNRPVTMAGEYMTQETHDKLKTKV